MDEHTSPNTTRKSPGPAFFMVALFVYLCVVHGLSIFTAGPTPRLASVTPEDGIPQFALLPLNRMLDFLGHSPYLIQWTAIALLYACMVTLFHLTRRLAKGPLWLGSLAAAVFMAHPAKTEVLFSAAGVYQLLGALLALLSLLACLRVSELSGVGRYLLALALFAAASFPFPVNATLFGVLVMLEFYPGTVETRRWARLVPFLAITVVSNGLHLETLYARMPDLAENCGPLLLLIYPIGLLPSTLTELQASPLLPWLWGVLAMALLVLSLIFVRNGAYRVCILALLSYRFYPGPDLVDLSSLAGGGQLLVPIALGCIALAGFCRWLISFEAWGRPTVALTTMICVVLFVLQFQANRASLRAPSSQEPPAAASTPEGPAGA